MLEFWGMLGNGSVCHVSIRGQLTAAVAVLTLGLIELSRTAD